MWKKTFIRLGFVMVVAIMGLLVVAAADRKSLQTEKECSATEAKCHEIEKTSADFIIWESLSRTVLSAVNY